jgi:alpha/beta superfamily hydrolase
MPCRERFDLATRTHGSLQQNDLLNAEASANRGFYMHTFRLIIVLLTLMTIMASAPADDIEDLEQPVCGAIREPLAFWFWSLAAGKPDPDAAADVPNAEPVIHRTKDGRLLKGYKLESTAANGAVKGFVLVAQGNAMLADQLLPALTTFSKAGIEVYIFDYRGYGNSEGKRRFQAIVSDYKELFDSISASAQGSRFLYGISFGGIVLLNTIGSGVAFDRAVIDSTPSRVSQFGCPQQYDPIANIPQDASRLLVIAGEQDNVVSLKDSQELRDLVDARGGRTIVRPAFAHPFMDSEVHVRRARLRLVISFLAGLGARRANEPE